MNERPQLLGTNLLSRVGSVELVEKYYPGWCCNLGGEFVRGWTGQETKVTETVIKAVQTIVVKENKKQE